MGQECPGKGFKGFDMKGIKQVSDFGKAGLEFWKQKPRILDPK